MLLLTKENLKQLPAIGTQANLKDPVCYVKLFTPWSSWTWYLLEYDPESDIAFCYVQGFENEIGDVYLGELREIRGPMGLKIERDRGFEPTKLSEIKKAERG